LSYSTHKQTSNIQKVAIENIEAHLTNSASHIRNKDGDYVMLYLNRKS